MRCVSIHRAQAKFDVFHFRRLKLGEMPGNCSFNDVWLNKSAFKGWLLRVEGACHKAHCIVCNKTFDVSNMGEAALTSHMEGK